MSEELLTESGRRLAVDLEEWIVAHDPGRAVAEALTAWVRERIRDVELEAIGVSVEHDYDREHGRDGMGAGAGDADARGNAPARARPRAQSGSSRGVPR